ncbi:hypothetical protein SPAR10_0280 [Streptococcus infantis SPAR10]|uniref:Uncharacterized protein n=1 Tax=Streptococcus infantis SPAR10 TaxID=1159208 RepID=J1SI61_9STRE|nr:hypothetical protein SPAR10_0280 [Streptococcus infantis SPAR10]
MDQKGKVFSFSIIFYLNYGTIKSVILIRNEIDVYEKIQ